MPPSEDLTDEIEAINSIYGDGTLVLVAAASSHKATAAGGDGAGDDDGDDDGTLANLAVPASVEDAAGDDGSLDHRLCLRLWFPPAYPACPEAPAVLGVQRVGDVASSNGHRRPGAAAHDAELFGAALAAAFQEGQVCLFDAVEEYLRAAHEAKEDAEIDAELDAKEYEEQEHDPPAAGALLDVPMWVVADPVVELKSTFVARCARVTSPAQAAAYIQHLKDTDRRVRAASHNMTAWRIREAADTNKEKEKQSGVVYQDCDDDGETAAGGRLLHLMQLMDLWNVVVVVTRWYGGHKLGPRRFALINQAARDAFVQAGLVAVDKKKK